MINDTCKAIKVEPHEAQNIPMWVRWESQSGMRLISTYQVGETIYLLFSK